MNGYAWCSRFAVRPYGVQFRRTAWLVALVGGSLGAAGCYGSHERLVGDRLDAGASDASSTHDATPMRDTPDGAECIGVGRAEVEAFFDRWARALCEGDRFCQIHPDWTIEECIESRARSHLAGPREDAVAAADLHPMQIDEIAAELCLTSASIACPWHYPWYGGTAPGIGWCGSALGAACPAAACASSFDCGPGRFCDVGESRTPSGAVVRCEREGRCEDLVGDPGDPCASGADCANHVCVAGTCRVLARMDRVLGVGERCALGTSDPLDYDLLYEPIGADRAAWSWCADGLACSRPEGRDLYCEETVGPGEPLGIPERVCSGEAYRRGSECRPWNFTAPGEPCPTDPETPWGCAYYGSCDEATGLCVADAPGERGEACFPTRCRDGLGCEGGDRCGDPLGAEEHCFWNADCASGLCDVVTGCCPG